MSEPEELSETATIYLPQPQGHRRGCLRYRNGLTPPPPAAAASS